MKRLDYLELLRMKMEKNVHHLEIAEVVLVHYNIINNIYQQNLRALYIFVPNKLFGQSLDILPKN